MDDTVPKPYPVAHLRLASEPSSERPLPERNRQDGFRDPQYIDIERDLDSMLEHSVPELAITHETNLLEELHAADIVSEGLARVTLKAIGLAQAARQFNLVEAPPEDHTYQHLGELLTKTFAERYRLNRLGPEGDLERTALIGTMSEIAFYSLAAYDASFLQPLATPLINNQMPRYVLPSTNQQDRARGIRGSSKKYGFDFRVTYQYGEAPDRYIQVKTRKSERYRAEYAPEIAIVALGSLLAFSSDEPADLVRAIADDAKGEASNKDARRIYIASRRLSTLIR